MKARLSVQVLPLKTQILRHSMETRHAFALRFAPGGEAAAPHYFAMRVGHAFRQAVQFGVIPERFRLLADAVHARQRFPAVFAVDILRIAFRRQAAAFAHHPQPAPDKGDGFCFSAMTMQNFARAAANGIIAVFHTAELFVAVKTYFADAVLVVIAEVLFDCIRRGFPPRHAAKAVIVPARPFQPQQQVAPYRFARPVGLVSGGIPAEMLFFISADFTRDLTRRIVAETLFLALLLTWRPWR